MVYVATTLALLKVRMAEARDTSVFWTDEEARLALNEALRDWNLLTGRWRTRLTLSTLAATPEVALGATMTYGMRVTLNTGAPLTPTSTLELDLGRPTWRGETTTSGGDVPTAPLLWAPQSLQQIVIWPPTAGIGTNNLLVDGVAATPVLVNDGSFVDLGDELLPVIIDYAIHCAAFKEGGARWRATLPAFVSFLKAAAEENSLLKASQAYRRFAGLDQRRFLQLVRQPGTQLDNLATLAQQQVGQGGGA